MAGPLGDQGHSPPGPLRPGPRAAVPGGAALGGLGVCWRVRRRRPRSPRWTWASVRWLSLLIAYRRCRSARLPSVRGSVAHPPPPCGPRAVGAELARTGHGKYWVGPKLRSERHCVTSTNHLMDLGVSSVLSVSCHWLPVGRGWGAAQRLPVHQTGPQPRMIWPKCQRYQEASQTTLDTFDQSPRLLCAPHRSSSVKV